MSKSRSKPWLTFLLIPVVLLLVFIPGMWMYVTVTATPIHPDPKEAPSATQTNPSPTWGNAVEQSRQIVRAHLTGQNLPALSVAVGIGKEIAWAEAFGFADLEKRTPATPNHRFRIGTASTVLTSAGAGLMLEGGRLKLDDAIQNAVPAFPKQQWPMTLRQVMGHTAGLRSDGGDEGQLFAERCERPVEALPHFAGLSLRFEPGTQYYYSNLGWIVVSAAVEAAAGEPFLSFMQKRVFDPLNMRDTTADSPTNRATPYFPRYGADPVYGLHLMRDVEYSCYAGASVFVSTPSDMVRFGMGINDGKLLQRPTVQMLQTGQRLPSGQETGYGLGWDIETVTIAGKPTRILGHDGDLMGGMVTSLLTLPEQGIVVSVMSNISYAATDSLAVKIAQTFAETGHPPVSGSAR